MKKFVLLFSYILLLSPLFAQTEFRNLSLTKALAEAKSENKKVFIDCYTSWCGPCKMMAEKIFPAKVVGDFMNEQFTCVKYDMEVGEGKEIAEKYHVTSYPTFLILDYNGRLLHQIVGASPDGEVFLQRLKGVLNEDAIANLEARYDSGERGFAFMLKYIRILKKSEKVEQARGVALELLTSLNDEERISAPCWGIYDDIELSPLGSGNMIYFLKHIEQFREIIGREQVDDKIASLFEVQLEDILRGKNRNITLADVEEAEKMLKSYHLTKGDYLFDYIALIKAILTGDCESALTFCKKVFIPMSDEKLSYLYFQPLSALKGKWSKQQKKELEALTRELSGRTNNVQLKEVLKNFADSAISML